jgi:hypothetical protein
MMLANSNYFVDYVEAVLLDERTCLNNLIIYKFLLLYFPKVTNVNYKLLILMLQKFQHINSAFCPSTPSDTKSFKLWMLIYTTFAHCLYHILW